MPSPTLSPVIQRIPSTLHLSLLASLSSVAAAAVGQPGESGIVNGLPVTRLPRLVPHQPPRPRLHLLQPPQLLGVTGRETGGSNLDTLAISPTNEKREEEEEDLPTSNLKPEHPPWWKEEDEDWSIDETLRIANEMGRTGKCFFCEFTCEPNPGVALWYNESLMDHREEAHPETNERFK